MASDKNSAYGGFAASKNAAAGRPLGYSKQILIEADGAAAGRF